ncbi:hypothetical protein HZA97_02030 [Candidatus Woesearchaeota archaeon]|nr:hypothetical protein [Candidatus Woesearchaeota archaeon]
MKVETCVDEDFLYKVTTGKQPIMNSTCSRYVTTGIIFTRSTCVEQTTDCYIKVKNYEQEVGNFGYKAYFEDINGKLDKGTIYKKIYPQDEEIFKWTLVHAPLEPEQTVECNVQEISIPKKKVCK